MRTRTPQPRRSARAIVLAVVLAVVGSLFMPLGSAAPAQADVATGGSGAHRGLIDWLTWGAHGTEIGSRPSVSTRTIGASTLQTTCTVSQRSGRIFAYRSGTWGGDALDNLYNVGGADGANTLVSGISNRAMGQGSDGTVSFQVNCQATLDGVAVPIRGLVIADAEQNNYADGQSESISARPGTGTGATWRIIDRARGCTSTSTLATLATDNTLTLRSDGRQCAASPGGPIAVAYMEGATSGTFSLTTQGGAASAIAIGTVLEGDFGDAPQSHGSAGAIFTGAWSGGALTRGTTTNVSVSSFALAQHQPGAMRLGATVDADPGHQFSAGTADDLTGVDDEDALFGYRGAGGQQISGSQTLDLAAVPGTSETISVSCVAPTSTPATVRGWIDFNRNGRFDVATESSADASCTNGAASLTWTIPADAKPATAQDPAFLRLRIAEAGTALTPTGMTTSGEVEDHPVGLGAPAVTLSKASSLPLATAGKPGDIITYTVTLTNTGRTQLRAPTIVDDMSAVLNGATFVGASVRVGGGAAVTVPLVGTELRWTGATALPAVSGAASSAVLTAQVRLTEARRGSAVVNSAIGSGTSVTVTGAAGPVVAAERVSVQNRVAVTVEVRKQWSIVGGASYPHGTQPAGLNASVALTGPAGTPVADATWATRVDGYTAGSTTTISESTSISAGLDCRLVSSSARVDGGSAVAMPATITLTAPHTIVTITNTVDCTSRLTLTNQVSYGDASPAAWTLAGTAPDGSGISGASGVTGIIRPGVAYALSASGSDPAYAQQGPWACTIAGTTEVVLVTNGVVQAPLGQHVQCAASHSTARLTLLKHIDASTGGSLEPERFTLTASPSLTPTIAGLTPVSALGNETEIASGANANRFDVRPGHAYALSERSALAYLGMRLERQVGQNTWVEVSGATISVPAGQHHVYRFVNAPIPMLALPLTGGIGADTYLFGGAALLLAALAFVLYRSRKHPRGGLA